MSLLVKNTRWKAFSGWCQGWSLGTTRPTWLRYPFLSIRPGKLLLAFAAVTSAVLVATLLTAGGDYFIGDTTIYTFYMIAIVAVGFRYGTFALLLTGVISGLAYAYYFADPPDSFAIERPEVTFALIMFTVLAVATGRAAQYLRRIHRNLRRTRDNLMLRTEELSEALQREMESRTALRNSVAMMCHEFRTPLSTIDIIAQNEARDAKVRADSKSIDAIDTIRSEIKRINQLLTALARGGRETELEAHQISSIILRDIVAEICELQRLTTPSHPINLSGTWPTEAVFGNTQLLRQLFSNLLINAAKYSPPMGPILVEGRNGVGFIDICVSDRGIGIPPDERERVFEQFFRASNTGAIEGTGLGLTLCRQIAQAHRGKIWVEENLPSGTRVTVRLPNPPI